MEHLFSGEPASNAMSKVNRALLVHFVNTIETSEFRALFNIGRLHIKQFLNWNMLSNTVPEKKNAHMMEAKASARSKLLKLTVFASLPDSHLLEPGRDQLARF